MSKISIKGVLLGGVVDIVATNIVMIPLMVFLMIQFDLLKGAPPGALEAVIRSHGLIHAAALAVGSLCSGLGGYVAACLSKHDELLNGLLSSYLCLAIGVYSLIAGVNSDAILLKVLSFITSPLCGLAGGYARRMQKLAHQSSTPAV